MSRLEFDAGQTPRTPSRWVILRKSIVAAIVLAIIGGAAAVSPLIRPPESAPPLTLTAWATETATGTTSSRATGFLTMPLPRRRSTRLPTAASIRDSLGPALRPLMAVPHFPVRALTSVPATALHGAATTSHFSTGMVPERTCSNTSPPRSSTVPNPVSVQRKLRKSPTWERTCSVFVTAS